MERIRGLDILSEYVESHRKEGDGSGRQNMFKSKCEYNEVQMLSK